MTTRRACYYTTELVMMIEFWRVVGIRKSWNYCCLKGIISFPSGFIVPCHYLFSFPLLLPIPNLVFFFHFCTTTWKNPENQINYQQRKSKKRNSIFHLFFCFCTYYLFNFPMIQLLSSNTTLNPQREKYI